LTIISTKRPLTVQISGTFARQVVVTVLSLAYTILLARWLGKAGYGEYGVALLIPQLLTKLLNLGLGPSLVYHLAKKDLSLLTAIKKTLLAWGVLSIGGWGVGIIGVIFHETLFPSIEVDLLIFSVVIFPILLLLELLPNILLGIRDLWRFNLVFLVFPPVALLAAWILLTFVTTSPAMALAAFTIGQLGGVLLAIWYIHRIKQERISSETSPRDVTWGRLLSYAWKSHLGNIIGFLNYRLDLLLVNMLAGVSSAGLYIVAVQIGEKLWLLSQSVSTALFPRLAELHSVKAEQGRLTAIVGGFTFLASLLAAIALALLAHPLVRGLFGTKYILSATALIYLLPGITASSLGRVLANDLAARGRPELNFWVGLFTVVVNIGANLWWIPLYGINGAAWATSLSYTLSLIIKLFLFQHLAGLPWWRPIWPGKMGVDLAKAIYRDWRQTG